MFSTKIVCFFTRVEDNPERSRTLFQVPPTGPGLQRQPSVGNVLARASSFNTAGGPLLPRQISAVTTTDHHHEATLQLQRQVSAGPTITSKQNNDNTVQRQNSGGSTTGNGVLRQGSQGSLFEQIASQAKDLMRETTRQSSQDGLLAHMDKVSHDEGTHMIKGYLVRICYSFLQFYRSNVTIFSECSNSYLFIYLIYCLLQLKHQAKEKITEAGEDSLFAPLEQVRFRKTL